MPGVAAYVLTLLAPEPCHKPLAITLFELSVNVLFISVSVVDLPVNVSVVVGNVSTPVFVICVKLGFVITGSV